ncbi:MAG: 50S ribosomal protein L20 [Chloroflexi bacterium]|nr:50S ribosomal protein L20 [Chloroflexota bacterium]
MARATNNVAAKARHKKVLKAAKGYWGARHSHFKVANQAVMRALQNQYRDRRLKKRDFRRLWIVRINAAARLNGLSYGRLIQGLTLAGVEVDRKMLADLAIADPAAFAEIASTARAALPEGTPVGV